MQEQGQRGRQAHEQHQLRLLSTQTMANEVAKYKNKCNSVHKLKIKGKEVVKHTNNAS